VAAASDPVVCDGHVKDQTPASGRVLEVGIEDGTGNRYCSLVINTHLLDPPVVHSAGLLIIARGTCCEARACSKYCMVPRHDDSKV
jgi:hypothetical protein